MRFRIYRLLGSGAAKEVPGAFRILTFHDIRGVEFEAFDRLVRYLLKTHGIISPADAEAILSGESPALADGETPCLLTFDDGFDSNVEVARDILSRYGVKAIFFLCPELIDLPRDSHRAAIVRYVYEGCIKESLVPDSAKFMSWDEATELVRLGHTVGSHTLTHSRLPSLMIEQQRREIIESGDRLETKLRVAVKWFAYPFGDLRSMDVNSVRIVNERYQFCCSGLRGLNSSSTRPAELLREAVDLSSPADLQHLIVAGGMDFRHKIKVRKLTELVRPALGDGY